MVYGYCRVSTRGQESYGNGLDVQEAQVRAAGARDVRCEAFTGTTMERPEWARLVGEMGAGDTLVVTKLDRIARTSSGGFEAVKALMERGVAVHILNMGRVDDTPTGRLILNVMLAFAEFDRDMVVERMAEGKAAAREKPGFTEGRPKIRLSRRRLESLVRQELAGETTARAAARELGISDRTYRRRRDELLSR